MDGSSDFRFHQRHRALTTPEYWFDIDEYRRSRDDDPSDEDQMLLVHLRFSKFSASIMKRVLRDWAWFRECVSAPLFAYGETDDSKWERFVSLLGFKSLNTSVVVDGESRRLFVHHKDFG